MKTLEFNQMESVLGGSRAHSNRACMIAGGAAAITIALAGLSFGGSILALAWGAASFSDCLPN